MNQYYVTITSVGRDILYTNPEMYYNPSQDYESILNILIYGHKINSVFYQVK